MGRLHSCRLCRRSMRSLSVWAGIKVGLAANVPLTKKEHRVIAYWKKTYPTFSAMTAAGWSLTYTFRLE